jgi:hypothetical protein
MTLEVQSRSPGNPMPTSTSVVSSNNSSSSFSNDAMPLIALGGGTLVLGVLVALFIKALRNEKLSLKSPQVNFLLKEKVAESDLRKHRTSLTNLKFLVQKAELLDSEKFQNNEFSMFSKIKTYIAHNVYEYTDLNIIVDLINVALDAQKSFASIYQIESQYHSKVQKEFYESVGTLLVDESIDRLHFKKLVLQQAEAVCLLIKSDEGKNAISTYAIEIAKVSDHDFGISLLRLFKKNHMSDYALIGKLGESIDRLEGTDLVDLDGLMLLVLEKSNVFDKIGAVLDLKEEANSPDTHRKVLQFIGLKKRYQASYAKFQDLLATVKEFHRYYQTISEIREKYPAKSYHLPVEFTVELPGLKLYNKYIAISNSYQDRPVDRLSELAAKAAEVNDDSKKLFKNGWDRMKISTMAVTTK